MTRPRPGRATRLVAMLGIAVLVAACGATQTQQPPASGSPAASQASAEPASSPSGTDAASAAPSAGSDGSPSPQGSASPLPSADASARPGSADACSGTAENRDFYAALAASVAWDVFCATLPQGWFVESGSYRLSNGGQLSITYKGPAGARLVVREGAYCLVAPGCIMTGTDAGSARFGDLDARLLNPGDGSWLVFAPSGTGGDTAWQASGSGMDGPTLAAYTAAFARVDH
jgi:hypothetical protein